MKIVSWNVNGIRAVLKNGFLKYLEEEDPDIVCLQEVKAHADQVEIDWAEGYELHWNSAEKKGYSGTLVMTRRNAANVTTGIGVPVGDTEGRVITVEYDNFFLVNVYTPNAKGDLSRLSFRHKEWDVAFLKHLQRLNRKKPVIFCGDLNVAHKEIDLARPKANRGKAGFTDEEREGIGNFFNSGFLDTFREFEKGEGHYTWWSYRAGARKRNIGWRIDYFGISKELRKNLKKAFIRPEVTGSDHCPIGVVID